jgi:nucleoside-diphosphate-sugar epimerase
MTTANRTVPIRVGVTGATGQVGATLVARLRHNGWNVVAAARNKLGAALLHAAVPDCDIRVGALSAANGKHLLDDCDVIVNCALAGSGGNPRQAYTRNRELINGLLEAKALRWLVHFSTVAIYGELIREQRDERRAFEAPKPESEYGRSKLYVERYAARQSQAKGITCSILRLGHVYGAGIGRSREIIEFARDPHFRLPFDGQLPSNAIHVDRLAGSVLALLARGASSPGTAGTFSFAEHDNSWRDVFNWHSSSLGLPSVTGMGEAESHAARNVWASSSIRRDVTRWVRGMPVKGLLRSPALFDLALRALVRTPTGLTSRVTDINRRIGAREHVARVMGGVAIVPPLYVSAGMPGPFLELGPIPVAGPGSDAETRAELREWYRVWSTPPLDSTCVDTQRAALERASLGGEDRAGA